MNGCWRWVVYILRASPAVTRKRMFSRLFIIYSPLRKNRLVQKFIYFHKITSYSDQWYIKTEFCARTPYGIYFLPHTFLPSLSCPQFPYPFLSRIPLPSVLFVRPFSFYSNPFLFYAKIECVPYIVSHRSPAVMGCPGGSRISVLREAIKRTPYSSFEDYSL